MIQLNSDLSFRSDFRILTHLSLLMPQRCMVFLQTFHYACEFIVSGYDCLIDHVSMFGRKHNHTSQQCLFAHAHTYRCLLRLFMKSFCSRSDRHNNKFSYDQLPINTCVSSYNQRHLLLSAHLPPMSLLLGSSASLALFNTFL